MVAQLVHVRRPDGSVIVATRNAFEAVHRPKGWELVDLGVDPSRRVFFLAAGGGAGGGWWLRNRWPADALRSIGWNAKAMFGWPGGMDSGSLVVFHRPVTEDQLQWIRAYQGKGIRVLVNEDDDLGRIPRLNSYQATPQVIRNHDQAIREADGLIVSTDRLAEVYGPLARQTWICRNYLPASYSAAGFRSSIVKPSTGDGVVRVGWAGILETHRQDLLWIRRSVKRMLQGAKFTCVGDRRVPQLLRVTGDPIDHLEKDIDRYYRKMGRADIGLVPLDNGKNRDFNTSKSALKLTEWLTLGVPVVATDLPEQRRVLEGTGAGFLVSTPAEMAERVQELVHDDHLRAEMTRAASRLGESLAFEHHAQEWAAPLEVLAGKVA